VPTNILRGNDPQHPILSAVRESQTAFIDVVRSWTDITEQLTRRLSLPVAGIDVAGALDRTFDLAEQTLAAQRQFALTLTGVATRQVATAVERIDGAVEAVDTAVETVETTAIETAHRIEGELQRGRERVAQPQASTGDAPKAEPPKEDGKPDRRTYEDRSVEELRERARELEIEGRSAMSKDDLVAALRNHRQPRPARNDAPKSRPPKQERKPDRRSYEDRSVEELRERAQELEIEGRSAMSKDDLVAALRRPAK
jgi:Rho termination factor, N-terminal domain